MPTEGPAGAYTRASTRLITVDGREVASFLDPSDANIDWATVDAFGEEWLKFDSFAPADLERIGAEYFDLVSGKMLDRLSRVLDVGCGTGRGARYLAARAGFVEAVDPSRAVLTATRVLADVPNARVTQASVESLPFPDASFDFVMSLGVLHHVPDTARAIAQCVRKLKPGGWFLVYLYYNLDNRGPAFHLLFRAVSWLRRWLATSPPATKKVVCEIIAVTVYWPLARLAALFPSAERLPLAYYRNKSFRIMRNDALDRFGTPLEQRFSRAEIHRMLEQAGLVDIRFSPRAPYWHAVGRRA